MSAPSKLPLPRPRGKDGRFTPSTLLTTGDLYHQALHLSQGDHLLIPRALPRAYGSVSRQGSTLKWRIQASKVRGAEVFFRPSSRPSVRAILWAFHFSQSPPARISPTCGEPNCINPTHQGVAMSLSSDLCERFFQEAHLRLLAGEELRLTIGSEGEAIRYRAALNRWRKDKREENLLLGLDYSHIILRIRPAEERKPNGSFHLVAEGEQENFEQILTQALDLAGEAVPAQSATDLVQELFQEEGEGPGGSGRED